MESVAENLDIGLNPFNGFTLEKDVDLEYSIYDSLRKYKDNKGIGIHPRLENELMETIYDALKINLDIGWESNFIEGLRLVQTPDEVLRYFELRADVYKQMGYDKQFPPKIQGLEFDKYDNHSIMLIYKPGGLHFGNIRLIKNSHTGLLSDPYCDLSWLNEYNSGELSRLVSDELYRGHNTSGKLYNGLFEISSLTGINNIVVAMVTGHCKRYEEYGGVTRVKELPDGYGQIPGPCTIILWDLEKLKPEYRNEWSIAA